MSTPELAVDNCSSGTGGRGTLRPPAPRAGAGGRVARVGGRLCRQPAGHGESAGANAADGGGGDTGRAAGAGRRGGLNSVDPVVSGTGPCDPGSPRSVSTTWPIESEPETSATEVARPAGASSADVIEKKPGEKSAGPRSPESPSASAVDSGFPGAGAAAKLDSLRPSHAKGPANPRACTAAVPKTLPGAIRSSRRISSRPARLARCGPADRQSRPTPAEPADDPVPRQPAEERLHDDTPAMN